MAGSKSVYLVGIGLALLAIMSKKLLGVNVKPGVILPNTPEMDYARDVVAQVWANHGLTATITSGMDSEHMEGSLHYIGLAEDFRTHDVDRNLVQTLVQETQAALGSNYQVFLEYLNQSQEHMHVEYDPH